MVTFRYDPYLWVHLAGIVTVPLWLAICGLGLAVGTPSSPGLEQGMISLIGVLPILLMQLRRPFCIFSLLALALKPTAMTEEQRRILSLFRQRWVSLLALLVPIPLVWLLLQLYPMAVIAADLTPFSGWGRFGGLAVASGSFLMANLFLQVPASVLAVMATPAQTFATTPPYPVEHIQQDFTQIGLPLRQILPEVLPPSETKRDRRFSEVYVPTTESPETQDLGHHPQALGHVMEGLVSHPEPLTSEEMPSSTITPDDGATDDAGEIEVRFINSDERGGLTPEVSADLDTDQGTAPHLEANDPEFLHTVAVHPEVIHPELQHPEVIHPETDHELMAFSASVPAWDNPTGLEETFEPEPQPVEVAAVRISDPKPLLQPDSDTRTE